MNFTFNFQTVFFFHLLSWFTTRTLNTLNANAIFALQNKFNWSRNFLKLKNVFSADLSEKSTQIPGLGVLLPFLLSDQVNLGRRQCRWDRANLQYPANVQMCKRH